MRKLGSEKPKRTSNKPELTYETEDATGWKEDKRHRPGTPFQRAFLEAVDRKNYLTREEMEWVIEIEENMESLEDGSNPKYPEEWIRDRMQVARIMRERGQMVGLKGLVSMVRNEDRKQIFMDKWRQEHG